MKIIVMALLFFIASHVYGGVHCQEKITSAILHKNSNVYFKTSKTCALKWCQIKWNGEGDKDRAYSTLLAARTADRSVIIYWENLDSCNETNPTYQSPGYIEY